MLWSDQRFEMLVSGPLIWIVISGSRFFLESDADPGFFYRGSDPDSDPMRPVP